LTGPLCCIRLSIRLILKMMSQYSLLPITYSEFLDWYNRRDKQFLSLRLIPAEVGSSLDDVRAPGELEQVLVDTIPEYDEDFQIIISLVEDIPDKKYKNREGRHVAYVQEIAISDLKRLYPITERGSRLLKSRLDNNIQLGPPLFEDAIEEQDRRRSRQQARAGGNALIELYRLHEMAESWIDEKRKEEILDAVRSKVREGNFKTPKSIVDSIIQYDRQDKPQFPSTSIGSVYDYFSVVRAWHKANCEEEAYREVVEKVLKPAQTELKQLGRNTPAYQAACTEELTECFQDLETISPINGGRCPPRAGILFLDLRDQFRQSSSLDNTSIDNWGHALQENSHAREFAFGLWMVGAFFDFSTFADDYYERAKPPFMRDRIQ